MGIYANENWYKTIIGKGLDIYTKWVAKYSNKAPDVPDVDIWQYTSSGSVPGLTGNGGRVDVNHCYRDFAGEITGGCAPTSKPDAAKPAPGYSPIRRDGQIHLNNFTSVGIDVDGEDGPETRRGAVMVLQTGINQDYRAGLDIDGIWGPASERALGSHYVCKGECQYMVTALEILLMLKGYNPQGVECPGSFGTGLEAAVRQYQRDHGLTVDGIAGYKTFKSLL